MDDKQKDVNEQGGQGRIAAPQVEGSQQSAQQQADISAVDRQEGEMNNGELGGNFGNASNTSKQEEGS